MISPPWVWWVSHVALGMTAGLVYLLFGQRQLAERVPHRLREVGEQHVHKAA
jgi:hypothetical protein